MSSSSDHARKIRDAVHRRNANSALASSWRRSLVLHSLDPDDESMPHRRNGAEIADAQTRAFALIASADRDLDNLVTLLDDPSYVVLLADADGVVVVARSGGAQKRASDYWIGLDLSERREGTNATGTAIVEQRPVKIEDGEHFLTRNAHLVCDGAPIHGIDGSVVGSIDVTREARGESSMLGALIMFAVIESARRIELAGFRGSFPYARLKLAPPSAAGYVVSALVAIDSDDHVVGATHAARQSLGLSDARMAMPFPAEQILPFPDVTVDGELAAAERRAILRMLVKHGDNISAAAKALGISRGTLHRKRMQWRA